MRLIGGFVVSRSYRCGSLLSRKKTYIRAPLSQDSFQQDRLGTQMPPSVSPIDGHWTTPSLRTPQGSPVDSLRTIPLCGPRTPEGSPVDSSPPVPSVRAPEGPPLECPQSPTMPLGRS